MSMYRSWLYSMFSSVPTSTRQAGAIPMAFSAAVNPTSWVKAPYVGIITYFVVWWMLWNLNVWGMVRYEDETPEADYLVWIIRSVLYSFFLSWIPLFLVHLLILLCVKISVSVNLR